MEIVTKNSQETTDLGEKIGSSLKGGEVIALNGEMGMGKTTFVQGVAKGLGISSRIVSPTFIIMRDYPFVREGKEWHFFHVDLYRLEKNISFELHNLGFYNLVGKNGNIFVIEWADKLSDMPVKPISITITDKGNEMRNFKIENYEFKN